MSKYLFDDYYNKIIYDIDEESSEDKESSEEIDYSYLTLGESLTIDGIEVVCVYNSDGIILAADKNHDLDYYTNGYDSVNSSDYSDSATTYGYEWGGYGTTTGITDQSIGAGLTNTNSLIEMNLQPSTSGWPVLWDKVVEFRNLVGNEKWIVPSYNEILLMYNYRSSLTNLSTLSNSRYSYYWTSTENSGYASYYLVASSGNISGNGTKSTHNLRSRLFRQL